MALLNPTKIKWTDPTAREDGSPFGASDFLAFELGKSPDGNPAGAVPLLSLPTAFGVGESPIPSQVKDVRHVKQWLHLRTLDKLGQSSVWTAGLEVMFSSRPRAPGAFSAE